MHNSLFKENLVILCRCIILLLTLCLVNEVTEEFLTNGHNVDSDATLQLLVFLHGLCRHGKEKNQINFM